MNRPAYLWGAVAVFATAIAAVALRTYAEAMFLVGYGLTWLPHLLVANAGGFAMGELNRVLEYQPVGHRLRLTACP